MARRRQGCGKSKENFVGQGSGQLLDGAGIQSRRLNYILIEHDGASSPPDGPSEGALARTWLTSHLQNELAHDRSSAIFAAMSGEVMNASPTRIARTPALWSRS